jgi:hypothetical protein
MSDDLDRLDLTGIDQRHEPDPEFRAALRDRVAAIVAGGGPSDRFTGTPGTTTFDVEPSESPRRGRVPLVLVVAAAAAATVAAIALIITRHDPTEPADAPSPTNSVGRPPPSTAAQPPTTLDEEDQYGGKTPLHVGDLDPGTYAYLDVDGKGFNVRFTVPAGWTWNGRYLSKGGISPPHGAAIFFFGGPVQVYADPCHWAGSRSTPVSGTDVIALLVPQPRRNPTNPTSRGSHTPGPGGVAWPGESIELTVPDNTDFARCDQGQYRSWGPNEMLRSHQGPGQRDLVWAINSEPVGGLFDNQGRAVVPPVAGGPIIDAASFPGTPADVMSEIDVILNSIAVGHWG